MNNQLNNNNGSLCEDNINIWSKKDKMEKNLEMNIHTLDKTENENIRINNSIKNTDDAIFENSKNNFNMYNNNINRNNDNVLNKKRTRVISIKNVYSNLYKTSDILLRETVNEREKEIIENHNFQKDKYSGNEISSENKLELRYDDVNDLKKFSINEEDIHISSINKNKININSEKENKNYNIFLELHNELNPLNEHSITNKKNDQDHLMNCNDKEEYLQNSDLNNHYLNLNKISHCDNEKKLIYEIKKNSYFENNNIVSDLQNKKDEKNTKYMDEKKERRLDDNNAKKKEYLYKQEEKIKNKSLFIKDLENIDMMVEEENRNLFHKKKEKNNLFVSDKEDNSFLDEKKEKKYNLINEQESTDLFKNMKINELKKKLSENLPDTFKILLCTDNHLGYKENNSIQKKDSFNSFEEILFIAKKLNVDMILNSGDLFHKNKVSEYTLFKSMLIMRKYCHVDKKENWILEEEKEKEKEKDSKKCNAHVKEITNYEYEYYNDDNIDKGTLITENGICNKLVEKKKNTNKKGKKKNKTKKKESYNSDSNNNSIENCGKKKKKINESDYEDANGSDKCSDSMSNKYINENNNYYNQEDIIKDLNNMNDKDKILNNLKFCSVNEKYEKSIPFYIIHGNHDYPYSYDFISPLDILHISNLINYIGKNNIDNIVIKPILLNKNNTKISIYAIGWLKDERLYRSFENKKVKFILPSDYKNRINILVLHQNRYIRNTYGNNTKNFFKESFVPDFIDLVLWGHEHFSKPYLEESLFNSFYNLQLGSSVRTSLCANEYGDKYIGLLEIKNERFRFLKINLETVRPFELKEIRLSDYNLNFKEETILKEFLYEQTNKILNSIKENLYEEIKKYYLFKKLFSLHNTDNYKYNCDKDPKDCNCRNKGKNEIYDEKDNEDVLNRLFEEPEEREKYFYSILSEVEIHNFYLNLKNEDFYSSTFIHMAFSDFYDTFDLLKIKKSVYEKPLIKMKVEYDDINIINTQSFGSLFIKSIANPSECLSFYKKKIKNKESNLQCKEEDVIKDKDDCNMEYINEYNKVFDILFDYCNIKNKLSILDEKTIMDTMQNYILSTNSSFNSNSYSNSDFNSISSMVDKCSKDKIELLEHHIKDIPTETITDDYLKDLINKLNNSEFSI